MLKGQALFRVANGVNIGIAQFAIRSIQAKSRLNFTRLPAVVLAVKVLMNNERPNYLKQGC